MRHNSSHHGASVPAIASEGKNHLGTMKAQKKLSQIVRGKHPLKALPGRRLNATRVLPQRCPYSLEWNVTPPKMESNTGRIIGSSSSKVVKVRIPTDRPARA